jgi:hypothetical protein
LSPYQERPRGSFFLELSDCVAGWDALNSPLLGRNMLVARYNEQV